MNGIILEEDDWREREARHRGRLAPVVDAHIARQSRHEKHPVLDFLFEYYGYRASWLMRWSPGLGVTLRGDAARRFLAFREYTATDLGVALDEARLPVNRLASARWILGLLEATAARPPRYGCHGLHEWAMVYRAENPRHDAVPLRMAPDELAGFVASQPIACSHFDAFRFFTPAARPLNRMQPERGTRLDLEQRGCLHANMDLYKWAMKFQPWIGSDLVADAFLLACDIRELDMRASPYDLRSFGYAPVAIETEAGRVEYRAAQEAFAERAVPIRAALIDAYRGLTARLAAEARP